MSRMRVWGLVSAMVAFISLSLPVLTGNGEAGGEVVVGPGQRLGLLALAGFLLIFNALALLMDRRNRG